jgi:hypothetical protein
MFMGKSPKKATVKKNNGNIEFRLGDAGPTKYEIMRAIAKHHTVYGATVWLNTPLLDHEGKSPAELMLRGDLEIVMGLVEQFGNEPTSQ